MQGAVDHNEILRCLYWLSRIHTWCKSFSRISFIRISSRNLFRLAV